MSEPPRMAASVLPGKSPTGARLMVDPRWRAAHLLLAPHRLGFFLAMGVLTGAGVWWALVQLDRVSGLLSLPYALSPSLVHGVVMTFGFLPLFFSGFLFTAGPKWLAVAPPAARQVMAPLLLQGGGWLLWLTGAHLHGLTALAGLVLACTGLSWVTLMFWRLIRRSRAEDQLHARSVGVACVVGCVSLAGVALSLFLGLPALARAWVLTGLWGFVVVVYMVVAHRMIPFFTSSAMPLIDAWRPFWALWLMLAVAAGEVIAVWVEWQGPPQGLAGAWWMAVRGSLELAAGGVLLWLAVIWGLVQSLKNRLLAMLHIGFVWLGLALLLGGLSQWLGWAQGAPVLALGSLHALTMGCLASLMLAMVTRVSCGHSGRALVADGRVWALFWLLQAATLLRLGAAAQSPWAAWLLLAAAMLWAAVMLAWGGRLANWYGRPRTDGRSG
ncbi:MAG: NnrS family protein [Polaromonas sp.]|nr:NnrS family protein [Polaromonas sp.]MDP3752324.1 NnrS family protein [Polaromonas sp.]